MGDEQIDNTSNLLTDWHSAEIAAVAHMRNIGFIDAELTSGGSDGGIDATSSQAVAQVKFYSNFVGRPEIQKLRGAAHRFQIALFYTTSGYTNEAVKYADDAEIALFTMDAFGAATPVNDFARKMVFNALSQRVKNFASALASKDFESAEEAFCQALRHLEVINLAVKTELRSVYKTIDQASLAGWAVDVSQDYVSWEMSVPDKLTGTYLRLSANGRDLSSVLRDFYSFYGGFFSASERGLIDLHPFVMCFQDNMEMLEKAAYAPGIFPLKLQRDILQMGKTEIEEGFEYLSSSVHRLRYNLAGVIPHAFISMLSRARILTTVIILQIQIADKLLGESGAEDDIHRRVPEPQQSSDFFGRQPLFDVHLVSPGYSKLELIKMVRKITDSMMSLEQVRELVNSAPAIVVSGIGRDTAEVVKQTLSASGASIEIASTVRPELTSDAVREAVSRICVASTT